MKAINNTFDYFLDDLSYPDSCGIRIVNVGFSHNAPNYSCGYVNRKYFLFHYIVCIFRGNSTTVPKERHAVPLQTA